MRWPYGSQRVPNGVGAREREWENNDTAMCFEFAPAPGGLSATATATRDHEPVSRHSLSVRMQARVGQQHQQSAART